MDFLSTNVDIFEKVLSYLDLNDVLKCISICKLWYYNTNINSVWKRLCEKEGIIPEHWDWKVNGKVIFMFNKKKLYFTNFRKVLFPYFALPIHFI